MHKEVKENPTIPFSRRRFLKGVAAVGALSFIPWACQSEGERATQSRELGQNSQMAFDVLSILFPKDNYGPASIEIGAYDYLTWVLADTNYDSDIKNNLLKGFERLGEYAKETHSVDFVQLKAKQKKKLVSSANKETWGEQLFSRLVSMVLDALVIDPIYGMNQNEIGWGWLGHTSGQPRPNQQNKYPFLLNRKKEFVIISNLSDLS